MPATITHMALAGIIAAALLGEAYTRKGVAIVMIAVILPDLDSFLAWWIPWAHRSIGHTLVIPALFAIALWYDVRIRETSFVKERWGHWGIRVAWVSIFCVVFAHILLDMVTGVVNPLWPIHDQFYTIDGKIELSNKQGIIQTFIDLGSGGSDSGGFGSTGEVALSTGVEPDPGGVEEDPERIFPVARSGTELLILTVGTFVTWARFKVSHELPDDD